jgi:hypothetical protein
MREVELLHSPEILEGKPAHVREISAEIGGEAFHHGIAPTRRLLLFHDSPPDVPVKQDEITVNRAGGGNVCMKNAILQRREEGRVIGG